MKAPRYQKNCRQRASPAQLDVNLKLVIDKRFQKLINHPGCMVHKNTKPQIQSSTTAVGYHNELQVRLQQMTTFDQRIKIITSISI